MDCQTVTNQRGRGDSWSGSVTKHEVIKNILSWAPAGGGGSMAPLEIWNYKVIVRKPMER